GALLWRIQGFPPAQFPAPMNPSAPATKVARPSWRWKSPPALRRWRETPTLSPFPLPSTSFRTRQPVTAGNCANAYMSDGDDSDEALMLRFAGGEVQAFEKLYRRHELKVWRYPQRNPGNRALPPQLIQHGCFSL